MMSEKHVSRSRHKSWSKKIDTSPREDMQICKPLIDLAASCPITVKGD